MRKLTILSTMITFLFCFSTLTWASTIDVSDVGGLDPLLAVADLGNSGNEEYAWVNDILGTSYTKDEFNEIWKINQPNDGWGDEWMMVTGGEDDQWAFHLPNEEGYFLLKVGDGEGNADYSQWLFRNDSSTEYATIVRNGEYNTIVDNENLGPIIIGDEAQNGSFTIKFNIKDIDSISHIVPNGGTPVPEPATMLLLGTGLIGLAGVARKKFKK